MIAGRRRFGLADGWALVEPCCGSGAFTLHMLGARRSLCSFQGSKWPLRHQLEAVARRLGFFGQPSRVILGDAAPWAEVVATVLTQRTAVLDALSPLVESGATDPRGLYERLSHTPPPEEPAALAATLLWLQRMNFASKAVGVGHDGRGWRWVVHGLNTTSAYGVAGTERFGEVKPQGAGLLQAVKAAPTFRDVVGVRGWMELEIRRPTLVLLDPPYQGTTQYPSGHIDREGVIGAALGWAADGAAVIVCEAEPIEPLVREGWEATQLSGAARRARRQQFRRGDSGEEWITVWRGAR